MPNTLDQSHQPPDYGEIPGALQDTTILVAGAAGLAGTQMLYRLLYDPIFGGSVKKVIAIIRGETAGKAAARLPALLRTFTGVSQSAEGQHQEARLAVLNGDCAKVDFGLEGDQLEAARQANIVINFAADVRFTLPLSGSMSGVVSATEAPPPHPAILQCF